MFAHRSAGDARSFEQIAGCAVRFDAEFTGLAFANGAFDLRLRGHDPALVAHLTELAETQVQARQRVGDDDLRGIVEHRLVAALPERFLTADDVAGGLGMTRRTLSRRLRAQGTSFRGLCNALRYRLAKAYLQEGRSVTETAFLLGYGEQATFSAAFRGWSGQSPTEFAASA